MGTKDPDLVGSQGQAWKASVDDETRAKSPAWLGSWALHAPLAHPCWCWYAVSLVHLRDVPGVPKSKRSYPDATHEIHVIALDPDHPVDVDDPMSWFKHTLRPINAVIQFHGPEDSGAERVLAGLILSFVEGRMSPDSDYARAMKQWVGKFVAKFSKLN